MNKKTFIVSITIIFLQLIAASFIYKTSGGHPSSTGGAGEQTCARAGCHDDALVSNGIGVNTITLNGNNTLYTPGTTYTVTVSVKKASTTKFGFQLCALIDSTNTNGGTISLIENKRTHLIVGEPPFETRNYITHTAIGTATNTPDSTSWFFNWTAPLTDVGPVTLYFATNCTNKDNTSGGDAIYLSSLKVFPNSVGIQRSFAKDHGNLNIVVNNNVLSIKSSIESSCDVSVIVYDITGKSIIYKQLGNRPTGEYLENIPLDNKLKSGIYLVNIIEGNDIKSGKLFYSN